MPGSDLPTVVLVHGAFADSSGWAGVAAELKAAGITVLACSNPLRGLTIDADYVHAFTGAVEGPVVLVGHSYGGSVISQASTGLDNVVGLVFLAAFGLDEGETSLSVQEPFPAPLLATSVRPTSYDAGAGTPGGSDIYIDPAVFHEVFCADLPADLAEFMALSQRAIAGFALGEACGVPGWKTKPSWFLVSEHDNAISPDAERFMADRMGATTETIDGSHVAFIAKPAEVATFIKGAVEKVR